MRIDHSRAVGRPAALDLSKIKLFIAIPTRGTCSIYFASSLAMSVTLLTAAGADVNILEGRNGSVDFNRNNLLARFMATECTHIWFVDDDMGWNPDSILKMLKYDKEFIAGAGPLKADGDPVFACKHATNEDQTPVVVDGLIPCSHIGGAFVLLKREAITKMMIGYPGLKSAAVDPSGNGYHFYEFLYSEEQWKGEDYVFCERWKAIGGEIWMYPDISFTHTGTKDYRGNYHQHLLKQDQPIEAVEKALDILGEQMKAKEDPGAVVSEVSGATKEMLEAEPGARRPNGFITALERIMLCESYIKRIAIQAVKYQNELSNKGMMAYAEPRAGEQACTR